MMAAGGHAAAAARLSREAVLAGVCTAMEDLSRQFHAHGFAGSLAGRTGGGEKGGGEKTIHRRRGKVSQVTRCSRRHIAVCGHRILYPTPGSYQ